MSRQLAALLILLLWGIVAGAAPIRVLDLGIAGEAEVLGIEPYTESVRADVPVVTTRFVTDAAAVVDLYLEGQERPIGVTPNHRVYSVDRGTWVEAGALRAGERLGSAGEVETGGEGGEGRDVLVVARVEPREGRVAVYNLEVSRYHTYFVGDDGLWVHNECGPRWVGSNRPKSGNVKGLFDPLSGDFVLAGTRTHDEAAKLVSDPDAYRGVQVFLKDGAIQSISTTTAYRPLLGAEISIFKEWLRRAKLGEIADKLR